jgi:putative aldouronate transport system substrate-binding protein
VTAFYRLFVTAFAVMLASCAQDGATGDIRPPDGRDEPNAPAKLRIFLSDHALAVPDNVDQYIDYMNRQANVELQMTFIPHSQYLNQIQLKFAGGDFPDVYQSWSAPSQELINGDKVHVLNGLIERYGPNLKKNITEAAWDSVTVKGQIFAIPQPSETLQGSVLYIRKDWLDKLGLSAPTSSDELLDVMRAFRDRDPNGNGLKDEIPFTMREKLEWGENIFGMWGVGSKFTETYENGELLLGSVHPRYLDGLRYMNRMYMEGLLDNEFLMNTMSVWDQKIKSGRVGIWAHAPRAAGTWQQALEQSVPEQEPEVIAIKTPRGAGYAGPIGTRWSPTAKTFILMKTEADPAKTIQYFDWLFSEEGRFFAENGVEGVTYRREDGRLQYDVSRNADIEFIQRNFAAHGMDEQLGSGTMTDDRIREKLSIAFAVANSQGFVNETVGMPNIDNDYGLHSEFIEHAALVMIGERTTEDYERFVEEWKRNGGQSFIDERTAWYKENRLVSGGQEQSP